MVLEPTKQYTDLELYLDDMLEYLYRKMDKIFQLMVGSSYFSGVSKSKKHPRPASDVDDNTYANSHEHDDEENNPFWLHSGKLLLSIRDQLAGKMAEARLIILERNSVSIRVKSKVVIISIGKVCFKLGNNANFLD